MEKKETQSGMQPRRLSGGIPSEHSRSEYGGTATLDDESVADPHDPVSLDKRITKILGATYCVCVSKEDASRKLVGKSLKVKVKEVLRKQHGINREDVVVITPDEYVPGHGVAFKSKYGVMPIVKVMFVKHPRRSDVFIDCRHLPQILFREKFEEFVSFVRCIGAKSMTFNATSPDNQITGAGPDEDGAFAAWIQQSTLPRSFDILENELPSNPMKTHANAFPFISNESEWQALLQRRLSDWVLSATLSVSYAQLPRVSHATVQKLQKLEIDQGSLSEPIVNIHQSFDIQFFPKQDYITAVYRRLCKEWGFLEVIGFFVTLLGLDAGAFIVQDAGSIMCASPPLTVAVMLDPAQFNKETIRHTYKVKRPEQIQALLEARDKLTDPLEYELRQRIEDCSQTPQTRQIYKSVCGMYMDAYVRTLYSHIITSRDDIVTRFKKMAAKGNVPEADISIRCAIVGDEDTGKTSLIQAFNARSAVLSPLNPEQSSTVDVTVDIASVQTKLHFSEYSSSFAGVADELKNSETHVVLIVFDVSNRDTFISAKTWYQSMSNAGLKCIFALVGNKCDKEMRDVTLHEGLELAEALRMMYFETSSAAYKHVDSAITVTASLAVQHHIEAAVKKRKRNMDQDMTPMLLTNQERPAPRKCCIIL